MELISVGLSIFISSAYVASIFYNVPKELKHKGRDHPEVIKFRIWRVCLACGFSTLITFVVGVKVGFYQRYDEMLLALQLEINPGAIARCCVPIIVLYVGPIVERIREGSFEELTQFSLQDFRDLVFGPWTEEYIYRGLVLTILRPTIDDKKIIVISPLIFGIAHIHHGYENYKNGFSLILIVQLVAFQLTYTTLFGILENYLFLTRSSLLGCILVHSICNFMGFPSIPKANNYSYIALLIIGVYGFFSLL